MMFSKKFFIKLSTLVLNSEIKLLNFSNLFLDLLFSSVECATSMSLTSFVFMNTNHRLLMWLQKNARTAWKKRQTSISQNIFVRCLNSFPKNKKPSIAIKAIISEFPLLQASSRWSFRVKQTVTSIHRIWNGSMKIPCQDEGDPWKVAWRHARASRRRSFLFTGWFPSRRKEEGRRKETAPLLTTIISAIVCRRWRRKVSEPACGRY